MEHETVHLNYVLYFINCHHKTKIHGEICFNKDTAHAFHLTFRMKLTDPQKPIYSNIFTYCFSGHCNENYSTSCNLL